MSQITILNIKKRGSIWSRKLYTSQVHSVTIAVRRFRPFNLGDTLDISIQYSQCYHHSPPPRRLSLYRAPDKMQKRARSQQRHRQSRTRTLTHITPLYPPSPCPHARPFPDLQNAQQKILSQGPSAKKKRSDMLWTTIRRTQANQGSSIVYVACTSATARVDRE